MNVDNFVFKSNKFDDLFPFYILFDQQLNIVSCGSELAKICSLSLPVSFNNVFMVESPTLQSPDFDTLQRLNGQAVILTHFSKNIVLRGRIEEIIADNTPELVFIGSPWLINNTASWRALLSKERQSEKKNYPTVQQLSVDTLDSSATLPAYQDQTNEILSVFAKESKQGILFLDKESHITWCNDSFLYLTNYQPTDVIGSPLSRFCQNPLNSPQNITKITHLNFKNTYSIELLFCKKERICFWVNLKIQALPTPIGNHAFFATIEDINKKKIAEEQLKTSQNQMAMLIANLQTGILLENECHQIVLANNIFCQMFGINMPAEQLAGRSLDDILHQHQNLFSLPNHFITPTEQTVSELQSILAEEIELSDGRIFERDYVPIVLDNHFKGHLWQYTDVTAHRKYEKSLVAQEAKYRNIITNMNLGLIEVDTEDVIQYANQRFCEISGYAQDEILGKKAAQLFIINDSLQTLEHKMKLREQGVSDYYQIQAKNKRGELRWWLISGAPNYNDKGEFIGSLGIHLDITEQKELEKELEIAKQKAEESAKGKETFLANMSHEIRTPLNAILGMIRELSIGQLTQKQSMYIKNAKIASQHLLSIVNNILDMSKIEAGEFQLEKRHFSLSKLIDETVNIMQINAKEKLLQLNIEIDTQGQDAYIGDPARLRQILINLLGNSIKFTEKGSINLHCEVSASHKIVKQLRFTISDTGIGMDKHYLKSLFKKFSQEDLSIGRKYGGTGLGMAITYELVQLMKGNIEIDSQKGHGTTIKVMLPMSVGDVKKIEIEQYENNFDQLQGKRVLLVEDNEMNRLVATNTLLRHGMQVIEAENGNMAIEKLSKQSFNFILMDLQMPEMDGISATNYIRQQMKIDIPIIALTANAFKKEKEECLASGMNDYITKPFEENILLSVLLKNIPKNTQINALIPDYLTENNLETPVYLLDSDKLYDLSRLIDLSRGDEKFIKVMINLFVDQTPTAIQQMQRAFHVQDFGTLKHITHRIKPSIDNLKIDIIRQDIREIEMLSTENPQSPQIEPLLNKVETIIDKVVAQLIRDIL